MGSRRQSRELAMQTLYYIDMSAYSEKDSLNFFCSNFELAKKSESFYFQLVEGILKAKLGIDDIIRRFSNNWKLSRMACVDRNVLRIAVYEMLYCEDIPYKVSINEAIDVAKKYGTEESGAFINGILDSIRFALDANQIEIQAEIDTHNSE
jgi:N utilization substance protein B